VLYFTFRIATNLIFISADIIFYCVKAGSGCYASLFADELGEDFFNNLEGWATGRLNMMNFAGEKMMLQPSEKNAYFSSSTLQNW